MRIELSTISGLDVFTDRGKYVGKVDDVVIDPHEKRVSGLAVGNLNRDVFDTDARGVIVPYRWVISIGDVAIIKELSVKKAELEDTEEEK